MNVEAVTSVRPTIVGDTHALAVSFEDLFRQEFERRYASLHRYLSRLSDDPALAADIAQETFVRLYHRGSMPDNTGAWLATVANNLFRNEVQGRKRRARIMDGSRATLVLADQPQLPDAAAEANERKNYVRAALDTIPVRDRQLLLLRYEGFSYRELAIALDIAESSVGTLLARAKSSFRRVLKEDPRARE
ncbi:MAG: sigma-70 family RNA polymerase sigma factor [Gemmatimonadaceae bacterium]